MLVSIAVDPTCFGPSVVTNTELRTASEVLLRAAVSENAVFLCDTRKKFSSELMGQVLELNTSNLKMGQQLGGLAPEIRKCPRRAMAHMGRAIDGTRQEVLREVALNLRADAIVCANEQDAQNLADLKNRGLEVCSLSNYLSSETEKMRRSWLETTGLEDLSETSVKKVLGSAIKYSYDLTFLDRYLGAATRDGRITKSMKEAASGVVYVCGLWQEVSPYCGSGKANVVIYTAGGNTGARGYVDPHEAKRLIELAIKDEDSSGYIGRIKIEVKEEANQEVFTERLIEAGPRCWPIGHSIKSLSYLLKAPGSRGRVYIGRDGEYPRRQVREIKALRDA